MIPSVVDGITFTPSTYTASSNSSTVQLNKANSGTVKELEIPVTIYAGGPSTTNATIIRSANNSNASYVMEYANPVINEITGLTAAGGSATLSGSVKNKKQYY